MTHEPAAETLFIAATRQKADRLFGPIPRKLTAVEVLDLDARTVSGYGRISFLAVSSSAFRIVAFEACRPEGAFGETMTLNSSLDLTTGLQRACGFVTPCGVLMRVRIENLGAAAELELSGYGLPHSSG